MKHLLLLLLCLLMVLPAAAQDDAIHPDLLAEMEALETATRQIRQLDGVAVERAFPTRQETIAYLQNLFDEELPIEDAERYQNFYVALGLLEPDVDLRAVYLSLLSAQVAGFYDSDTKVMNVIPTRGELSTSLSFTEEIIYVHEFTHALQDQFFDLDRLMEAEEIADHPDRSLATLSLIEGDASAVMNVYTQEIVSRNPLAAFQLLGEGLRAGNLTLPAGTPAILGRELLFPYEGGMVFVTALYQVNNSWDTVNAAFDNPPTTTEQILHPEKYIAGEAGVDVMLPDASAALGDDWTLQWDTVLGEWYLREHLLTQLPRSQASAAAAGWGGDRLHIYAQADTGTLAWVTRLVWDTPADQAEFEAAYATFGDEKYGAAAENGCWSDADSALCIQPGGDATVIAQGPTLAEAQALLAAE